MIKVTLFGPFKIQSSSGDDLTPHKSTKAQGTLALLLMAPNYEKSRDYLADKLWSDRSPAQAAGSLKTVLYDIRRALGHYKDVLISEHGVVRLDRTKLTRDIDAAGFEPEPGLEFLEGIRIHDPEFTTWLLETRRTFEDRKAEAPRRPRLVLRGASEPKPDFAQDAFFGSYSQSIADWCAEKLVEADNGPANLVPDGDIDYVLLHTLARSDAQISSSFSMVRTQDNLHMWQHAGAFPADPVRLFHDADMHRAINHRVDRTLFELAPENGRSREAMYLQRSTLGAVRLIYRNRGNDMAIARRYLHDAQETTGRGLHCAWLAYTLCFDYAEGNVEKRALRDQAEDLCRKALERDPYSAMTLALVSYVTTLLLRKPLPALDLADKSIEINRSNPLAWSFKAAAHYNLGDIDGALKSAAFGRRIAGDGPYRYAVETFYCIAASLANQVDEAIRAGEAAAMLKPDFKASLRYLAMLYSYRRDEENLDRIVRTLRQQEPDFSVSKMLETSEYPSMILRQAPISST